MKTTASAENAAAGALPVWKLEDAKERFSAVVRQACENGPQRVSVRGQDAVADYAHFAPDAARPKLAVLFGESPLARVDHFEETLQREPATFRDPLAF